MKSKNKFLDGNWHPVEETSAENLKSQEKFQRN
jgi:hypothetical protein